MMPQRKQDSCKAAVGHQAWEEEAGMAFSPHLPDWPSSDILASNSVYWGREENNSSFTVYKGFLWSSIY